MGVGRNLAYKKDEFFNVNGFINHIQVRSGDDDLFINEAATSKNTTIAFNPESFTYSKPKTTYKDWLIQKRRHIATANHYKKLDQVTTWYILLLSIIIYHFTYYIAKFPVPVDISVSAYCL